ncbi:MAG: D-3-phosphoglycerate dehydrogenase / 2-oxoglutarate reductase [Rhodospirillaceae bacterium]|jgi:D-3-phosphoglycerate dehydrogenase|nr:D-3-phosphoglycerate dehydrogenase / 2-oxoglutarate reductase [Rhodospirillaceae bacterium]
MNQRRIAVIGDRFMKPEAFVAALESIVGGEADLRSLELAWPDEPMRHGYVDGGIPGLKEYQGDPDEIVGFLDGAEILVNHLAPITGGMLDRLPNLRFIAVSRGGPVNIDMAACRQRGVTVVNTPGRNASAVAEFTIGAILAETRLIRAGHEALRRGEWRGDLYRADRTGSELSELTVGLIGYGLIGTRVVRLLKPFGCRILVADPYQTLDSADAADGVMQVDLDRLLSESDVVSLHARVTEETKGFLGRAQFARMKRGAYFINTARGPMVNYEDLHAALESGHLRGAMLETFWLEPPPPDAPLLKLENVTLTPHIAGASTTTVKIAARMAAEEVRRYLAGEPPVNPC